MCARLVAPASGGAAVTGGEAPAVTESPNSAASALVAAALAQAEHALLAPVPQRPHAPPPADQPERAGAASADGAVFTAQELAEAARLRADWDHPPSDQPSAALVASLSNPAAGYEMMAWRFRGEGGLDIYESQCALGTRISRQ